MVVQEPNGCVKAWNLAAAASTGHVLVQLSDDWNPAFDWDVLIWEALEKATKDKYKKYGSAVKTAPSDLIVSTSLVLAIHDGHRNDALLCMAIMTRARYEEQGKEMFSSEYFGVFSDTEMSVRAYDDGVVVQAQHIVMEHNHPLFAGVPIEKWHETTQRQNAPERYETGKAIFNRRNPKRAIP